MKRIPIKLKCLLKKRKKNTRERKLTMYVYVVCSCENVDRNTAVFINTCC